MKFCEALDRFVGIRQLSGPEKEKLFQGVRFSDKKSYQSLILNTVVVDFLTEISPLLFEKSELPMLREVIEQELYNLCIKVNPQLDIHEVSIPLSQGDTGSAIPILEGEAAAPSALTQNADGQIQVEGSSERFLEMEETLRSKVIGQDPAIQAVSAAIRKAKAGLKSPDRPVGSFLFVGSTGVGKTETAKALHHFLYGKDPLIRIDCSEYAAPHEYSKLIGAPPGYIGHNDGGFLTEALRGRDGAVVVFDEIEKAHLKVHNLLLQIMEEGMLTDSKGSAIPFRNSVVILTSNVGVDSLDRRANAIGFDRASKAVDQKLRAHETRKALENTFPPEFLNRIDEIVVFRTLTRDDTEVILDRFLSEVQARTKNLGLAVVFSGDARSFLVDQGFDDKYGARPLRRAIQKFVENPLAELILSGSMHRGDTLFAQIDSSGESLEFRRA